MMARTHVPPKQSLWILFLFFINAAADDTSCPVGAQIHPASWRCFWLSGTTSSWPDALDSCRDSGGAGDLASAVSLDFQTFIHNSFPVTDTVWVWMKASKSVLETGSPAGGQGGCPQMALGTRGRWRTAPCSGRYLYLCEKEVTKSLPSVDTYVTGLVLMSGVYAQTHIQLLPKVPDIGQMTVEMQLFPGLWFSHAGRLVSVDLVVQPYPASSLARVQILRPYCNPNYHLVPPGCSSLLNPFSCCSAVPLCNTTGGCSVGQYWCHLLEACVPTSRPCSVYGPAAETRGFALPPRYPAVPPFYHLVADFPLRINSSSEMKTLSLLLPERATTVYPDDIVSVQHTRDSGSFLHCLDGVASGNSPWRQSYVSLRTAAWGGWWEGGLTSVPPGRRWVDGVVCDLRMLYVDDFYRATTGTTPSSRSEFGLRVIHPVPDENNQIHVQVSVPTLVVVKVVSGENARSSWSAPVLQTGVSFSPSCPEGLSESCSGCRTQSRDAWFSSVTLVLTSVGLQTLNVSVMDAKSSESVSVRVWAHEAVTGLSVEPRGCRRMIVDTAKTFIAKVKTGSSVRVTWVIDNLENFSHEGESYSVSFKKPAEYKLRVTVSNPVSSQTQQILLTADEMSPLAEPEFLEVTEVVALDAEHLYTLRVKVDVSLPVTFRWDFGDGSSNVIHTQSAPCQTMTGLEKEVYVQDSVNYTYLSPDDYTLHVHISNQYDTTDVSMTISVRPQLSRLLVSSSPLQPLVNQPVLLEASTEPSDHAVVYTWDFGDASDALRGRIVSHAFTSPGVYNVTACANNTLTVLTSWTVVEVTEMISGLEVSCSGPSELGSATEFRATVTFGTSPVWSFDFGDGSLLGNVTDGFISHVYRYPGNYSVHVTASNIVSQSRRSVSVEVYKLAVNGVLPTECVMSGRDVHLTALVNGNVSILTFHWLFGDGSPPTVVRGQSTAVHTFQTQGIHHVSLTVFSLVTVASFNMSICVEAQIVNVTVQPSQEVVSVGENVCFQVVVHPEQMSGCQFRWFSSPSGVSAVTGNTPTCFIFEDEGVEDVAVTASNNVSDRTARTTVTVQIPVSGLSVEHDIQSGTLSVNASASFWVASCAGSNVSALWDFGDGSPLARKRNVSHVYTSPGRFTVTVTALNSVSRDSVTLEVNVLLPIPDLSLHANQPYAAVGEETLISAISGAIGGTTAYYWTVDGVTSTQRGTYQFRFAFPKPGVYRVRVVAQNLVSRKEAAVEIEVFERIEGLQIECQSRTDMKYVPTQHELLLFASITNGSNVTYRWVATQSGINTLRGDGERFRMFAESPGRISVHLTASNRLGEVTGSVSLVAVQLVSGTRFTTQSHVVALRKSVNISVSVDTGSDLRYLWYVGSDISPLQTDEPFLLHTFANVGDFLVRVSVQNVLSSSNVSKEFNVQEEIQEVDFEIQGKLHPFYIATSDAVRLRGLTRTGSDQRWSWTVTGFELFNASNQTFIFTFPRAGVYLVSLNVSNGINWQMVSHGVTVEDAIQDLTLNISKSPSCTEEEITFIPTISKGSDVRFTINFRNWIHSQGVTEGQFTTSTIPAGTHLVTVKGWNRVSSAEVTSSIVVVEQIQDLRLVNCCSGAFEALKDVRFEAESQSGLPVNYTWTFHMTGSESTRIHGQEVTFTPPDSGLLSVSVLATDGVCSRTVNDTVTVQWHVKKLKLVCHSERILVGHAVEFSAKANGGSNPRFLWDFGDSTEALVTTLSTVNHTYHRPGGYSVTVKVLNSVSDVSTALHVEVEEPQCTRPQVSLIQSQSTVFRSRQSLFEASVDVNCSAYKATYQWDVLGGSDCTDFSGNKVILGKRVDATSPLLSLPKRSLDTGRYCLVFTVSFQGTPLLVRRKTRITVVHSKLVAVIKGGPRRLCPGLGDLVLDGSDSEDPDVEPGLEDTLQYRWSCVTLNSTQSHVVMQPIGGNSSRVTVPSTELTPDTVYVFTLTVSKAGREPAYFTQTVTVSEVPVLPVIVGCASCSVRSSLYYVSPTSPTVLSGKCGQCDDEAQYTWSAEDQFGVTLDLNEVSTSTGRHSPDMMVRSGVLQPGRNYTFTLTVSQPGRGLRGSGSLTITPNNPPRGGRCDLSPQSDIRLLETAVAYNCSGWRGDEGEVSQLVYNFQVSTCQRSDTLCTRITLYRGTRSSFGSLVPMGSPGPRGNTSLITVTLLVEDYLGSKAVALNRVLMVESPPRDEASGRWLKNKSQTELWALIQHGNPQEIIPFSIALTSRLNQMESGQTAAELADRREIRGNVTRAVASLPVSSWMDVDQISSVLSQSTAVPGELVCDRCQQKILESVEKMIHVLQEQSPGVSSAAETGRNILNILGNTVASVSESVDASSSPSDTLQSASSTVLSALSHAAALTRSLMHSHVDAAGPLLLSTPHINTVGFHGDPSDLLCTSNHVAPSPQCLFQIPPSLAADLRGQRSELVQVLVAVDLGSNPALTAAEPPISTALVGMEFTTPQGHPIPIQGLDPERAIRVTLPRKQQEGGGANGTCLAVTLPDEGSLNLTVGAVEREENAGLYIAFNFSLGPGAAPVSRGHVRIEVTTNASQNSLVRERDVSLSAADTSTEETIFLSPLLDGTNVSLSVCLSSSLSGGPVLASVCVFTSLCRFYSEAERRWSSVGLQPLDGSSLQAAQCRTPHLTLFGASLFLQPGAVTLLPPPAAPVRNVVVGIVCGVLVLVHLLVGLVSHRLDHLDSVRLRHVPLCGRPGLHHYRVLVKTGWRRGAGTTAHVGISLYGVNKSGARHLQREGAFQRNSLDQFHLETDDNLGEIWKIRIWHDNTGLAPSWFVQHVVVWDLHTDTMFFFLLEDWLSVENQENGSVEKEVLASCPEELSQFGRVLVSQLTFGMVEHHLWLSLWERPAHSRFTRGQRVTCSALVLHLYLALGALWFGAVGTVGHSGPVSARLLVDMETVAVGMTIAVLVFPLQWLLCFLFRKAHCRVTVDVSVPPSPVCHSVEMDVFLGRLSQSSLLSLPDSSGPVQDSPSSLLDSKALDSSILDFWAASGLAPRADGSVHEAACVGTWPSCDSLLNLPLGPCLTETPAAPNLSRASPVPVPARQLRRKKAVMQLHLDSTCTNVPSRPHLKTSAVQTHNLTTLLTLSEEDLLMSIAAEVTAGQTNSSSDSGRDSPRTNSSLSSISCSSSWSEQSEDKSVFTADTGGTRPPSCPSPYAAGLYKCPSVDSVASTVLPCPSADSTRCSSTTRIGIARAAPGWTLPSWAPGVIYPAVLVLLGVALAVVGLYGSFLSRTGVLMWLISSLSAFLTSGLLLEPLKVCVQALLCTALWRPVDPEVEEHLAEDSTVVVVVRAFGEHGGKVRPPCGYGLLQAKEEARKIRALRSLMRHCVVQLLFLLLVLMVNYQDGVEQRQARLLHSAIRHRLHTAPRGVPNLTAITDFWDAERWMNHTLLHHLHHDPRLVLVGSPRLQVTHTPGTMTRVFLGNSSAATRQVLSDMHMTDWSTKECNTLSVDFTHYHRESGLFVCVSMTLEWTPTQRLTPDLSIRPLLIPPSSSGLDLQLALTVLLILSALLILFEELWSVATEHAQYALQCRHWLQLSLALLSLATAILQLCFLSEATRCVSKLRSDPDGFIDFTRAAVLAQTSSQSAAVLLTLLVLKLLGTLRFVRRWVVLGRVLQRAWTELWAVSVLLLLLLLLCAHLGNTLFSRSLEGFLSVGQTSVSVLSILRGRLVLHRLCSVHPVLGPLYGLLLTAGSFWMLARLCGAVLIHTYRTEQAELYRPTIEPQDYEMVELFIKRLKLWMGLAKTKEFRHRVKFEGMDVPPSRSSQDSRLSTVSTALPSSRSPSLSSSFSSPCPPSSSSFSSPRPPSSSSPRPPSSSSPRPPSSSSSSSSDAGFDVQPYLDRLLPCVTALLSRFDHVNQITEDVHDLETKLQDALTRRRRRRRRRTDEDGETIGESAKTKEPEEEIRRRKTSFLYARPRVSLPSSLSFSPSTIQAFAASVCRFPRSRSTHSESETFPSQTYGPNSEHVCGLGHGGFPRRRAWHSGSSHSADAAQRTVQAQARLSLCDGGAESSTFTNARPKSEEGVRRRISDGVPVKRKAWTEQD